MVSRLVNRLARIAASRYAPWGLFAVAFAESSFSPVPPDVMLAPMVMARPERALRLGLLTALASVLGGLVGYAIGFFLTDVAHDILALTGHPNADVAIRARFDKWGVLVILVMGLVPLPYKLVTISAGLAHLTVPGFIAASAVTRSARFLVVAMLVKRLGPAAIPLIKARMRLIGVSVVGLLAAAIALYIGLHGRA